MKLKSTRETTRLSNLAKTDSDNHEQIVARVARRARVVICSALPLLLNTPTTFRSSMLAKH